MSRTTLQPRISTAVPTRKVLRAAPAEDRGRRSYRWLRVLIAVAVVGLVAAGTYYGFAQLPAPEGRRATGLIAANEVTVAARMTGRIKQLTVVEGDRVAAGSTVAVLDGDELEAVRREQVAVIAELRARLGRSGDIVVLESGRSDGQIARANAELGAARSREQQTAAELADVREEAARVGALVEQQLVPRRELDRLQAQVAVAEARQKAVQQSVASTAADLSLAEAGARQIGIARREVAQIRAQLQQAEAQLAQVEARLADTTLVSPLSGVVSLRVAREGEVVNAGDPIVVILDPDDVWVKAAVEESAVGRLALGDQLQVELLSGERRTGRVTFLAPEAGFATDRDVSRARRDVRTFGIKVALSNADHRLPVGMTAFVLLPQGAAAAPTEDVLAVVNGVPITSAEVDAKLGASLAKLQEETYNLRRAQLDTLIEEQLLTREAARRGITPAALADAEIHSRIQPVTTADASAFFEANKARLQGGPLAAFQDQIETYLRSGRLAARRREFVASLRQKAKIDVFLEAVPPSRVEVPIAGAYVRGNPDAPVTIVEFSDFHSPYSRWEHAVIQQVLTRYGDKVRLVYKDMPLDAVHPNARAAAEAARCAGAQGKFWEFHDKLFTNDPDASPGAINRFAREVGLDVAAFEACSTARRYQTDVEASVQDGTRLGVSSTPTFFINGRNLTGAQPFESFVKIIDEELKTSQPATSARNVAKVAQ